MKLGRSSKITRNLQRALRRGFFALLATLTALGLSACSGDMFSRGGDEKLRQAPSYRKINPNCSNVDLSSRAIDPKLFRSLLKCLNAYGALDPLQKLIDASTDAELNPITDVINHYLLENPSLLYQVEHTLHALKDNGVLDATLHHFGRLFENPELIRGIIQAAEEGGSPELLQAVEQTTKGMSPAGLHSFMDAAISIVDSRSVQSLQKKLRTSGQRSTALSELTQRMHDFLQNRDGAQEGSVGRELLRAAMSGELFNFWDKVMGSNADQLQKNIPQHVSMMKVLLADEGKMLKEIALLHHYVEPPLVCLNGGKQVPDLHMHLLREISLLKENQSPMDYMARVNLLTILAVKPFCQFPKELATYYPSMVALANSTAAAPAIDLLKGLYRNNLARPVLGFLAGTGPEDRSGFMHTVPIFSEINERDAWSDLLLALTVIHPDDRAKLADSLGALTQNQLLGDLSTYDAVMNALGKVSPSTLHRISSSVGEFFQHDEPFVVPVLKTLRRAYFVNDVHPFIELGLRFGQNATEHQSFFSALVKISHNRHFPEAMTFISRISRDGTLKELLQAGVTLFHKSSLMGKTPIRRTSEPPFLAKRTHNLSAADLMVVEPLSLADQNDPCLKLRLDLPFEDQIVDYMRCANQAGKYDGLEKMFKILSEGRTSDGSRSYLAIPMDLINRFEMKGDEAGTLVDSWLLALQDGSFKALTDLFSAAFTDALNTSTGASPGPLMKPLLEVNRSLVNGARSQVRRLMDAAADLIESEEVPAVLRYAEKMAGMQVSSQIQSQPKPLDRELIQRWVKEVECPADQRRASINRRVDEVIDEYRNAVVGWELVNGRPRREWKVSEFKTQIAPLLAEFGDVSRSAKDKTLAQASMNVLRYFSLRPGEKPNRRQHYTPQYLVSLLKERSEDLVPISYFYPGERVPRLRLASTLDRLEMLLLGADFKFIFPENFALKFIGIIGKAWGDEKDPDNWPDDIREEYERTGVYPQTLRQAYGTILKTVNTFEGLIRYPKVARCGIFRDDDPSTPDPEIPSTHRSWIPRPPVPFRVKAAFYNIKQVLSVLEENLPAEDGKPASPMAGGMLPFRDLFYEFYTSSRLEARNPRNESGNHLSVITQLVRLGLTRQLTRQLSYFNTPAEMSQLTELVRAITQAARSPVIVPLVQKIMAQGITGNEPTFIHGVLDEVFTALEQGPEEAARLKQILFYGLIDGDRLELIEPVLKSLNAIFAVPGNLEFISNALATNQSRVDSGRRSDWITSLLTSAEAARMVRAIYDDRDDQGNISEDQKSTAKFLRALFSRTQAGVDMLKVIRVIESDQKATQALDAFIDRANAFKDHPTVSAESVKSLTKEFLHYFSHTSVADSDDRSLTRQRTADTIRRFAAARIRSTTNSQGRSIGPGEAEEFMLLAARDPEAYYEIMIGLSEFTQSDGMKEFMEMLQRALSNSR